MMKNKKLSKFSKERVLELVIEGRKIMEDREKSLEMILRNSKSKDSKIRLDAHLKRCEELLQEEKRSGIYSKDTPSLTLAEQRELGLDTGTTMVVSFGKKRK
jgi:hypothetical protein|tara:strand:- start:171 stop:476 length:306 start_codon:yes stop_codon:yes gene_type:complete